MTETEWSIQKVKRLKKKQLIQIDLVLLLFLMVSFYIIRTGWPFSVFLGLCCLLLWIFAAHTFYTVVTGKTFGTKTMKLVHAYDKDRRGYKSWRQRQIFGGILLGILSITFTILLFVMDFRPQGQEFTVLWPFIGAFAGSNVGEMLRITTMQ